MFDILTGFATRKVNVFLQNSYKNYYNDHNFTTAYMSNIIMSN